MPKITNIAIPNAKDSSLILSASSKKTASGNGDALELGAGLFYCFLNLTAFTNTDSPTLDAKVEGSEDGEDYETLCDFERITPQTGLGLYAVAAIGDSKFVRLSWTLGGAGDFTFESYVRPAR